ncbi:MAG: GSCFA domain-containing protein [Hymenobacteraceae bacterium]|nr:GSCFA domain-containing protein [Hymenobacteraceae bacterium]
MMFRTEVQVPHSGLNLTHRDKIVTIGSCFAEVMGNRLLQNKAEALVNPFGTIFNPVSVSLLLQAVAGKPYDFESHLVQHNGIWYAYDLHSSLSSPDKDQLTRTIQERLQQTREHLQDASLLVLTLGTAVAYKLAPSGKVVANCHKLPASHFQRVLLQTEEMLPSLREAYTLIKGMNPSLKLLLTVSPVRHIKETIPMNSVSKSTLRVLCHQLTEAHEDMLYFPAYEIMMDDLRDYRFYKRDMIHPTELAEDYIWQKFVEAYFAQPFRQFLTDWGKMQRSLSHKAFHPASEAHQHFLRVTLEQLQQLGHTYGIDISAEAQQLQSQLAS